MKYGVFDPIVNYGRQVECLKAILCGIKKKGGYTVKRTRLPISMPILANKCSLLHSVVFGYFNSISLAASCVAAFWFFKTQIIHNFESV
jgi:hypothetical protein